MSQLFIDRLKLGRAHDQQYLEQKPLMVSMTMLLNVS